MSFGRNLNDAQNYLRCLNATLRRLHETANLKKQRHLERRIEEYKGYLLSTIATLAHLQKSGFVSSFDILAYRKVGRLLDDMQAFNLELNKYNFLKEKRNLHPPRRIIRFGWLKKI